jgi:small subunit ribosomal protein S20
MPITKSAKKRLKQNEKRRILNLGYKRRMKKIVKEVRDLVKGGKKKDAKKLLPQAYKIIDKAAKRGIIKENTAARKKSRLTKFSA